MIYIPKKLINSSKELKFDINNIEKLKNTYNSNV